MNDQRYCSQCYWSTNDPDKFPPKWSCSLRRAPINRDEDVCAAWASLKDVLTDKGMERWRKSNHNGNKPKSGSYEYFKGLRKGAK